MNFTFIWILDKLGLMPKPVEKPKRKPAKKVATKTARKRRLG